MVMSDSENKYLKYFVAIDEIFKEGQKEISIIMLIRLTKFPFGLTNYLLGCLTDVGVIDYALGTTGLIFKISIFTYIGAHFYDIDIENKGIKVEILAASCILFLTFYISYSALNQINQKLEKMKKSQNDQNDEEKNV